MQILDIKKIVDKKKVNDTGGIVGDGIVGDDVNAAKSGSIKDRKTDNIRCCNMVDIIFDKIIDLMEKDKSIPDIERYIIVKYAKKLKDPVKKFILLEMSKKDAGDIVKMSIKELIE